MQDGFRKASHFRPAWDALTIAHVTAADESPAGIGYGERLQEAYVERFGSKLAFARHLAGKGASKSVIESKRRQIGTWVSTGRWSARTARMLERELSAQTGYLTVPKRRRRSPVSHERLAAMERAYAELQRRVEALERALDDQAGAQGRER